MVWVSLVVGALAVVAGFTYLVRERLGATGAGMAALRTVAFAALVVLIANPVRQRPAEAAPATVLLDASLSMDAAGGRWDAALDSARSLAADGGTVFRVGDGVAPFDTARATAGRSDVTDALRVAAGRAGPVYLVTDGELTDRASVPAALSDLATVVLVPRDTVPNAALLEVAAPARVSLEDSVRLTLEIGTWGALPDSGAAVEIAAEGRTLLRRGITLPPAPGIARRTVVLPARALTAGTHVLDIRLAVPGDREPRDDVRARVVTWAAVPGIVLVARPADWESRYLMRELRDVTGAQIRGYAEIATGRWIELDEQRPVAVGAVRAAARAAALLITRGEWEPGGRRPRWHWIAPGNGTSVVAGDWYPVGDVPASPIGGALGTVPWDSLAPLTGIVPIAPTPREWTALSARLGRRGAERPALLGRDSAGVRELITAAVGMWRWALRGGASREAYRSVLAAGVDWLLGSAAGRQASPVAAAPVTPRGGNIVFRYSDDPQPDTLEIELADTDSVVNRTLRFDADGTARLRLPVGVYRWQVPDVAGATGVAVVESYSPEFPPRPVVAGPTTGSVGMGSLLQHVRERWWLFGLAIAALVGEWAWRTRRGLP